MKIHLSSSINRFRNRVGSTTPVFLLSNGFPDHLFGVNAVNLTSLHIRAQDPNQRTPYVEQMSFGPQIEFSKSTVLEYLLCWQLRPQRRIVCGTRTKAS